MYFILHYWKIEIEKLIGLNTSDFTRVANLSGSDTANPGRDFDRIFRIVLVDRCGREILNSENVFRRNCSLVLKAR